VYPEGPLSEGICTKPSGFFLPAELTPPISGDCDDDDPKAHPLTKWYLDADGDGYTDDTLPYALKTQCSSPGIGYYREDSPHIKGISGDCNDADTNIISINWYLDADGDGYVDETLPVKSQCSNPGADYYLASDLQAITGDCNDDVSDPKAVHMNPASVWYLDADGDGYGNDDLSTRVLGVCNRPGANQYLAFELTLGGESSDCNDDPADDYSKWVNPGQIEICNNPDIDDNCDGQLAGGYSSEKVISKDIVHNSPPKMSESKVVWSAKLSGVGELNKIRVYDIASEAVSYLNGGVNGAIAPHISENGNVVWTEGTDVFLYKAGGSVTNISSGIGDNNAEPWVNNAGNVAWESYSSVYDVDMDEYVDQYEVFLKPYGVAAMKITPAPHEMKLFPKIIGNGNVVFANNQVYLYKTSLATTLLSNGFNSASDSDMNESGKVVWSGSLPGDNEEIYLYDSVVGGAPVALTATGRPARSSAPKINSVGDVVWQTWNGTNSDIYVRYAGTASNVRVTNTTYNNTSPEINDDGIMVWQALFDDGDVGNANNGDTEIFVCKGDNPPMVSALPDEVCDGGNLPFQVTDNAYEDDSPAINLAGDVTWKRMLTTQNIKICLKRFIVCVEGNIYYKDVDGDGVGDSAKSIEISNATAPAGYSAVGGDCDDGDNLTLGPVDWYIDGDSDGHGAAGTSPLNSCQQDLPVGNTYSITNDDCDDTNPLVYQGCGGAPKINVSQGDYVDGYFVVDIPSIQSEGSQGVTSEASIRITATITDDGKVNASLYYRTSSDGNLTEVSMVFLGNGMFVADIPLDASASTIEYFVIAEDDDGNISKSNENVDAVQTPTLDEWGIVFMLSIFLVATYKRLSFNDC